MRKSIAALVLTLVTFSTFAATPATVPVVNVNTATETQLMFLPGVGDALSSDIVEYRGGVNDGKQKHLTRIEQLLDVKGIGEKKLAKMTPYVVFDGPTTATAKIHAPKVKP